MIPGSPLKNKLALLVDVAVDGSIKAICLSDEGDAEVIARDKPNLHPRDAVHGGDLGELVGPGGTLSLAQGDFVRITGNEVRFAANLSDGGHNCRFEICRKLLAIGDEYWRARQ